MAPVIRGALNREARHRLPAKTPARQARVRDLMRSPPSIKPVAESVGCPVASASLTGRKSDETIAEGIIQSWPTCIYE